jgi:hypothetical protein
VTVVIARAIAQVGQATAVPIAVAAVTVLAVSGRIDGMYATGIIVAVTGLGQPVGVALHNLASRTAPPPEVTAKEDGPHVS